MTDFGEIPAVQLPDDLLEEILTVAPAISHSIQDIFQEIVALRQQLRETLVAGGYVRRLEREADSVPSVAAVDGAHAIERSLGADMVLVVALGVERLSDLAVQHWNGIQYAHWERVLSHEGGEVAWRFARGVMAALELEILAHASHDLVILDGSHLTPIIGLITMLGLPVEAWGPLAAEVLSEHKTLEALRHVLSASHIVAIPKYDSSREFGGSCLSRFGLAYDDRTLMTMVLEEDEFSKPLPIGQTPKNRSTWGRVHIRIAYPSFPHRESVESALNDVLGCVRPGHMYFTYFRPHAWSPAYRIELKREAARSPERLYHILQALKDQVVSTEIQEPYPQYLADLMAKSVGQAMQMLRTATLHGMEDSRTAEYLRLFAQSYRTELFL